MDNEMKEYITFLVKAKDGSELEMAVMDEFELERKHYVVGALVKDDEIVDDGRYIYRYTMKDEEIIAEKITYPPEYEKVVKAYTEMLGEGEEE